MRVVEDLPYAEVAQRMGVPVARARTWVSRGLKKLRGALEAEEVSDSQENESAADPAATSRISCSLTAPDAASPRNARIFSNSVSIR